jgi:hypothetical protein
MYILQGKTRSTWHIWFQRQSMYSRHTLPVGSPRTWQPFTSHRQSLAGPLLPRKGLPTQSTASRLTNPWIHIQFLSQTNLEAVGAKPSICRRQATRLTRSISPACYRYVQYLLAGPKPSVLNRYMRRWQSWRCRLTTYHSLTFPINCLHFPHKGSSRSLV